MAAYGSYYLLDTEIIMDLLKKNSDLNIEENFINKHVNCCISTITWYEIMRNINHIDDSTTKQIFLDFLMEVVAPNVKIISFDEHAAWIAADIANNNSLNKINYDNRDVEQLSIAVSNHLILITNAIEKYENIKSTYSLNYEIWR